MPGTIHVTLEVILGCIFLLMTAGCLTWTLLTHSYVTLLGTIIFGAALFILLLEVVLARGKSSWGELVLGVVPPDSDVETQK